MCVWCDILIKRGLNKVECTVHLRIILCTGGLEQRLNCKHRHNIVFVVVYECLFGVCIVQVCIICCACTLHREGWSSGLIGQRGRFLRLALCTLGFLSIVITINSRVIFIC